jgi:hypothetical protein
VSRRRSVLLRRELDATRAWTLHERRLDIPVDELVGTTSQWALDEAVDPIAGLADDRVWIFHGTADPVVAPVVVKALQAYYAALVLPANIAMVEHPTAGHVFPTRSAAAIPCDQTQAPFIGSCDVDGARLLLEHLYGPFPARKAAAEAGELQRSTSGLTRKALTRGSGDAGWLYIPAACKAWCKTTACRLHVVFHGCQQALRT